METLRTFIALEIPDHIREMLAGITGELSPPLRGVRWIKPANIHLTLKFLGTTRHDHIQAIAELVERSSAGISPVPMSLSGLGAFPSTRNPKVIWAGIQTGSLLYRLQQSIEAALAGAGFAPDKRPFTPHLTLGRVKDIRVKTRLRNLLDAYSNTTLATFQATRLVFFKSELQPHGATYSVLKEVVLH